jgi:hypothetical protein
LRNSTTTATASTTSTGATFLVVVGMNSLLVFKFAIRVTCQDVEEVLVLCISIIGSGQKGKAVVGEEQKSCERWKVS